MAKVAYFWVYSLNFKWPKSKKSFSKAKLWQFCVKMMALIFKIGQKLFLYNLLNRPFFPSKWRAPDFAKDFCKGFCKGFLQWFLGVPLQPQFDEFFPSNWRNFWQAGLQWTLSVPLQPRSLKIRQFDFDKVSQYLTK